MAGSGCDGRDQNEMNVIQLLTWTARELVGNVTADLTTLQRVCQEHSTGIKKQQQQTNRKTTQKTKNKTQNKLQLCQLVNKEKHFTDSKFKGSKRL